MTKSISKREAQVLHLIAHENSTKEIAQELYISEHTVISHRKNLMAKLNAKNTAGMVRRAYEVGLLNLSRQVAILALLLISCSLHAQQEMEIRTDGIVVPRLDTASVVDPIAGMMIYDTIVDAFGYYNGSDWTLLSGDVEPITSFDSLFIARALQIGDENISYGIDTSGMTIMRSADTIFTIDNKIETKMNFRFQESETSGIILVKTTKSPSLSIFDSTATKQNVLSSGSIEIANNIILKSEGIGKGGEILVKNSEGENRVKIFSERTSNDGGAIVELYNSQGQRTFHVSGDDDSKGGSIVLRDSLGNIKMALRSDYSGTGDSRIITDEIQIDGGSDLAELFDITDAKEVVEPGLLVSLDPDNPGKLMLSNERYDRKIAGVLSGANGVKPGILMGQDETIATGDELVTLSGRTYVMANDTNGSIKVGDLITTSEISGQAMRAKNKRKAQGAIIGKAMTPLIDGTGYVLVLVNLQ